MRDFVERLLGLDAGTVVTVTAGLDSRRPGGDADRIRLQNLVKEARSRLAEVAAPEGQKILAQLDALVDGIELEGGANGVALIAAADFAQARLLPFPVGDAVSIGPTPATRYLVQGLRRSPAYRILVISDRATRLFEAVRDDAVEIVEHDFPMAAHIVPRDRRATSGRFALPPGRDDKELWRKFYRDVDVALSEASRDDPLPLIVAGVANSTALFLEVSQNTSRVVGTVEGAFDWLSANALAKVVWPSMQAELERQRAHAVNEIHDAVATGRGVSGMDDVWEMGRAKRGRRLVVEEGYRAQPSIEVDGHLKPSTGGAAEIIEDPVDEIIESVLRSGGEVEFVANDALADLDRIGLLVR